MLPIRESQIYESNSFFQFKTNTERRSTSFLRQVISMEMQQGNCASILGTVESPRLLEELFELFDTKSDHYHS